MFAVRSPLQLPGTLTPFLYPCLDGVWVATRTRRCRNVRPSKPNSALRSAVRCQSTTAQQSETPTRPPVDVNQYDHLDPQPPEYSSTPFTDSCTLTLGAGGGGHGCISFLREIYIANGPANGGDGGTGGSIYIQAVRGETSLHKLARRGILKAGRGKNGQGSSQGGRRGEDVLLSVPVGTVVREVSRYDPVSEEEARDKKARAFGKDAKEDGDEEDGGTDQSGKWRRDKWLLFPGTLPRNFTSADFPPLPRPRRSNLVSAQPDAPIQLDLDKPMDKPMLLAAGAMGGLGNPHFVTKSVPRPKYATKGDQGMQLQLQLELKLLADVGLVGLPNAGKSTLLRSITSSRARVGDWAFTTLSPNIGTVVLDNYRGRPTLDTKGRRKEPRTNFTIADIPGLIEDAYLDRGLGLGFLRHIERAAVLAFVVDLSAGDAVAALKGLWREVGEYEKLREQELSERTQGPMPDEQGMVAYQPFESSISPSLDPEPGEESEGDVVLDPTAGRKLPALSLPPISSKPWFVVATKADLDGTQENFLKLQRYLQKVGEGTEEHPTGKVNAWKKTLQAIPVSAMNKEGVKAIPELVLKLLDE
ncbi:hypothetical protein MBLNU230_g4115t1 [Neophaeotheca triangularis]